MSLSKLEIKGKPLSLNRKLHNENLYDSEIMKLRNEFTEEEGMCTSSSLNFDVFEKNSDNEGTLDSNNNNNTPRIIQYLCMMDQNLNIYRAKESSETADFNDNSDSPDDPSGLYDLSDKNRNKMFEPLYESQVKKISENLASFSSNFIENTSIKTFKKNLSF